MRAGDNLDATEGLKRELNLTRSCLLQRASDRTAKWSWEDNTEQYCLFASWYKILREWKMRFASCVQMQWTITLDTVVCSEILPRAYRRY